MHPRAPLTSMSVRGALFVLLGVLACGGDTDSVSGDEPSTPLPPSSRPEDIIGQLAALAAPCTFATGTMTVLAQSAEMAIISRGDDDSILVNGELCMGAETATATNVNRLNVNEGALKGAETVY